MTVVEPVANVSKSRVERYISTLDDPQRKAESEALLALFARVTDLPAMIWGTHKVGYGRYPYTIDGGRGSEFMMAGVEPAKKHGVVAGL